MLIYYIFKEEIMKLFNFKKTTNSLSAHDYITKHLTWQINRVDSSNINNSTVAIYESYIAMINPMLEMEAKNGASGAILELGERYLYGIDGYEQNVQKAKEYFLKAAELGHPDGYAMLTKLYQTNEFGMQDWKLYFKYLELGAKLGGSCVLSYNLFCAYMKGNEAYNGYGFKKDVKKAYEYLKSAAGLAADLFLYSRKLNLSIKFENNVKAWYNIFIGCNLAISDFTSNGKIGKPDIKKAILHLEDANELHVRLLDRPCADFEQEIEELKNKLRIK